MLQKITLSLKPVAYALLAISLTACSSPKDEPVLFNSKRPAAEAEPPVKDVPADILASQRAFSTVARQVMPVVVNISTISRKKMVRPFYDLPPSSKNFSADRRPDRTEVWVPASSSAGTAISLQTTMWCATRKVSG